MLAKINSHQEKSPQENKANAELSDTKIIKIYTDGACSHNPGPGGLGVYMICGMHTKSYSEGYQLTTNNRMELLAVIKALSLVKQKQIPIELYSDSKYIIDALQKKWVYKWQNKGFSKTKNPDLWQKLLSIIKDFSSITWIWVKGHSHNKYNNYCDQLAVNAYKNDVTQLKVDHQYLSNVQTIKSLL